MNRSHSHGSDVTSAVRGTRSHGSGASFLAAAHHVTISWNFAKPGPTPLFEPRGVHICPYVDLSTCPHRDGYSNSFNSLAQHVSAFYSKERVISYDTSKVEDRTKKTPCSNGCDCCRSHIDKRINTSSSRSVLRQNRQICSVHGARTSIARTP
ncbi:uncharacterized protein M421DRAFT_425299 [Didymella exigua CBS 183.55]|uniref:Uncharacterized protein n=1 Tax=Didymella exigua CBS 183.55 TaxID=1150837 RepID=A0A6A5RBB4_9PLEO|nr:uncharacterized protein M421DRAFT_425299 [Didymella exigua CBS 183.55]KAF1923956.1 hypothetical protein M421DRAFT_425299 [Didymella exigua CBS 183.55]